MISCYSCNSTMHFKFRKADHEFWACSICKLECIHPRPNDAILADIYGEQYYDAWGLKESESGVKHMKQTTFSRYLKVLGNLPPGTRLLDCGAATGFMVELAKARGLDAYAIELSHFGAEACLDIIGADHVYEGEVEAAQFSANPENRFDIITMIDFIEHVRDPRSVLQWAHSRLRTGGGLLLVTPKIGSLSHKLMGRRWPHYNLEHLWYFSPTSLSEILNTVGFSVTTIRAAPKRLSLAYITSMFRRNTHSLFTSILYHLDSSIPGRLSMFPLSLSTGDMLVYAHA